MVAVPFPLSLKVIVLGSAPVSAIVGVGEPVVVTVYVLAKARVELRGRRTGDGGSLGVGQRE